MLSLPAWALKIKTSSVLLSVLFVRQGLKTLATCSFVAGRATIDEKKKRTTVMWDCISAAVMPSGLQQILCFTFWIDSTLSNKLYSEMKCGKERAIRIFK